MRLVVASLLVVGLACGCAGEPPSLRARYVAAVNARLSGDYGAFQAGMLALAAEAPGSREGRLAKAVLGSSDVFTAYLLFGALGVAMPSFVRSGERAQQTEAKENLTRVQAAWARARDEQALFEELRGIEARRYFYFVRGDRPFASPDAAASPGLTAESAAAGLDAAGIVPHAGRDGLLAVAVANLDADDTLDIWTVDDANNVVSFSDDLE